MRNLLHFFLIEEILHSLRMTEQGILFLEYYPCYLDEVGVEHSCVILLEYLSDLSCRQSIRLAIYLIGFSDHLHDSVFDTIMDHLHVVSCAI